MRIPALLTLALLAFSLSLFATEPDTASEEKPFAEARIVLQMADGDAAAQAHVLNVANNLIKHYGGPDFVDLEIVAYGPGISLLFPDNEQHARVESLLANDVRFVACMNTIETLTRTSGRRPDLIEAAIPVQTGVARLVERAQQGFVVIRP